MVLAAVSLLAVALLAAGPAIGNKAAPRAKSVRRAQKPSVVVLRHVNTKEILRLRFVDDRGRPVAGLERRTSRFFRCHHTKKQARMHPRLLRLLFHIGRHYPGKRIEVVSGYRHPSVAKNPRSPHMKGLAADFRVAGVENTKLRDYLRRGFKHVGVGYYPNSSFVHLDVRKGPSAFWVDISGPGETSVYFQEGPPPGPLGAESHAAVSSTPAALSPTP